MDTNPDRAESVAPADHERVRFYAYSAAAVAAALATAVFAVLLLMPDRTSGQSAGVGDATGFLLFEEIHATMFVKPGFTGANSVELVIGRHDEATPEIAGATLSLTNPADGSSVGPFEAEPVSGSPGTFNVPNVAIPTAGDWEFGLRIREADEAVSGTTVIAIGASSNAG